MSADGVDFSHDIQPILAKRCYACHGPAEQEGGLALHQRDSATSPTESGILAIKPSDPEASHLLSRVTSTDESERMPPEGPPLAAAEIALLRKWIADGAPYGAHWSFVRPSRPTLPEVRNRANVKHPLESFCAEASGRH